MERKSAASGTPDVDGKERRSSGRNEFYAAVSRSALPGSRNDPDLQEDWPSMATADPAFWLKGLDQ